MDTRRRRDRGAPADGPLGAGAATSPDVEIIELGGGDPAPNGHGSRPVVAASLSALVVLVAMVGLRDARPTPAPSASSPPIPVARASPDAVAPPGTPPPSAFPWAWTEFELPGYGRGSSVASIWTLDDLFVVEIETDEGPDGGPFGPVSSVLLASADGASWTDSRVDLPVPGFVVDVGATADGRLAVLGRPDATPDRQAWVTQDGSWERLADPLEARLLGGRLDELVLAGCDEDRACAPPRWGAIVGVEESHEWEELLVSVDGVSWQRPDLPIEGAVSLTRLTAAGDRWYVVATHDAAEEDLPVIDLLSSHDLVTWEVERVAVAEGGGGRAMAVGRAGPVLVGSSLERSHPAPRAWVRLTDGAWFEMTPGMLAGRTPSPIDLLIAIRGGYLAMSASSGDAWYSADGLTWDNRPAFHAEPGDRVRALATSGHIVLAGGRTASGRPAIWRSVLEQTPAAP